MTSSRALFLRRLLRARRAFLRRHRFATLGPLARRVRLIERQSRVSFIRPELVKHQGEDGDEDGEVNHARDVGVESTGDAFARADADAGDEGEDEPDVLTEIKSKRRHVARAREVRRRVGVCGGDEVRIERMRV